MTEWRALTDDEIVELATRLRSLAWPSPLDDVPQLVAGFGWKVITTRSEWVMLDTGFGMGSGKVRARDGMAMELMVRVTDFVAEEAAGRARVLDQFVRMFTALTGGIGAPTARIPGASPEIRWGGAQASLVLRDLEVAVELALIANSWLASDDRAIELQEQGLNLPGWDEFAEGLAQHLATLPTGAVVKIIEPDETAEVPRYAQFLQSDTKLFAEVVGDEWLDPALGAGEAGERLLTEAGWHQPDEDHSGNWWLDSAWPIDSAGYDRLASMVVTGLRDAFRISDLSAFHYKAWNGNAGNRKLDLPLLGLPSAD
jgi:hypothetical protein